MIIWVIIHIFMEEKQIPEAGGQGLIMPKQVNILEDQEAMTQINKLRQLGYSADEVKEGFIILNANRRANN